MPIHLNVSGESAEELFEHLVKMTKLTTRTTPPTDTGKPDTRETETKTKTEDQQNDDTLSDDYLEKMLRKRLGAQGKTLVIRAAKNTKAKAEVDASAGDASDENPPNDEGDDDEGDAEGDARVEVAPYSTPMSEEQIVRAIKSAAMGDDAGLAAKVRGAVAGFIQQNPHIMQLAEVQAPADQENLRALVEQAIDRDLATLLPPEPEADDEIPF